MQAGALTFHAVSLSFPLTSCSSFFPRQAIAPLTEQSTAKHDPWVLTVQPTRCGGLLRRWCVGLVLCHALRAACRVFLGGPNAERLNQGY